MANVILEFLGYETAVRSHMSDVVASIDYLLVLLANAPDDFKQTVVYVFEALQELYLDLEEDLEDNQNLLTPGRIPQIIMACDDIFGRSGAVCRAICRHPALQHADIPRAAYDDAFMDIFRVLRCGVRLAIYTRDLWRLMNQILPEFGPVGGLSRPAIRTEVAVQPMLIGINQQVEEVVEHDEPPASRDPELLREQEEHDWADRVRDRILSPPHFEDDAGTEEQDEVVWMLPFKRTPKEFTEALLHGPELQAVREEMMQHGCPCVLPSGAKIFVRPHQYQEVLQQLELHGSVRKASHLIIMDSLKTSLEEIMGRLPSKLKCKVNEDAVECVKTASCHRPHDSHHEGGEDSIKVEDWLAVEKTFLCKVRRFKRLNEVSQSTRDSRKGTNPRRYELSSDFS